MRAKLPVPTLALGYHHVNKSDWLCDDMISSQSLCDLILAGIIFERAVLLNKWHKGISIVKVGERTCDKKEGVDESPLQM